MTDTYGPIFNASSPSYILQSLLENRLARRLVSTGSTEFSLTWKISVTPSGRAICRLRALARRISASGYGGWRTPTAGDSTHFGVQRKPLSNPRQQISLHKQAGWATPNASRTSKLRACGNAIVPQVAAVFLRSVVEAIQDMET